MDEPRWTELDDAKATNFNYFDNPVFTRHNDGRITVDRWAPEILIADELLENAEADFMRSDGEFLEIHVANGAARYWLADVSVGGRSVFRLLEATLDDGAMIHCGRCNAPFHLASLLAAHWDSAHPEPLTARDSPESIAKDFTDGHMGETHDQDTREGIAAGLARWIRALVAEGFEQGRRSIKS